MTFTSFSQNFEDVMLWRALKNIQNGFYIDVGAHDPTYGSVTKAFYDQGWSGINIEPIPAPFELLQVARPRDVNLQVCAGAIDGEIDIYDVLPSGLATTQLSVADKYRAAGHPVTIRRVPINTLNSICKEHVKGEIHFLKIDVEGFEKEVLLGANFSKFRPWLLVIEATYPNSPKVNYLDWENIVLGAGYRFAYFDGLNRFYVAFEHDDLLFCFNTPPNFFDGFALSSTCFFSRQVAVEAQQAETKAQQAEAKAQQAEAKAQQAETKAQQAETKAQQAETKAQRAEAKAQQAETKAQQAETKAQQAEAKAQQAETKAQQAEAALTAIHRSSSWRLTTPLRIIGRQVNPLFQLPKTVKSKTKEKIKVLLAHVKLSINRRPTLKRVALKVLTRFPSVAKRIRRATIAASPAQESLFPISTRLANLTPRARNIHADLTLAMENKSKENSSCGSY